MHQADDPMTREEQSKESIEAAVDTIRHFIKEVTGREPNREEIAWALTRYFVLNEIREFIELRRRSAQEDRDKETRQ